ncbi:pilin N-terminal domain-containing protein [Lactobacillus sp. RTP31084st1_D4_RTP31084_210423]|uniref:pilin N-terminal domain-containing protein n=1 Tax=unclassified Lactobacillus TaxID=2620435 RepID=UPI0034A5125C
MKNARSKIMSAAMLSANVLTLAAPAIVHAAEQPSASTQSSIVQNKKEDENKKTDDTKTEKSTDNSSVDVKAEDKKADPDNPQSLKEQTMVIRKVIATNEKDLNSDSLEGVNGSKFTVYDVTDLMNTIIKEKLKVDDSSPSDKQVDQALKEADNSNSQEEKSEADKSDSEEFDENSTEDNANKTISNSTNNKSKIPSAYKSVKSSSSDAKTEKASTQAPEADLDQTEPKSSNSETSSSKSSSSTTVDDQSKSSVEKSKNADDKSESDKKSEEEEKLVAKVEQMRKDDTIRKEVASRAAKLDPKSMKTFAQVTTEHDKTSNKDGVARVKVPIDGKYHAYYVVNTETPKEAMAKNSDPIVILTPITDKDGKYSPEFTIYPKSEKVLPEKTPENKPENGKTSEQNQPGQDQAKEPKDKSQLLLMPRCIRLVKQEFMAF